MTNKELAQVMNYLDAEFASGAAKMTNDDKINRLKHWREEIGDYRYSDVMDAVRELSKTGFPPKTAQVRGILDDKSCWREPEKEKASFRIWRTPSGEILFDINFGNGGSAKGSAKNYAPWEIIKWRWMVTKRPEHSADWESIIYAREHGQNWEKIANDIYQRMIA